MEPLSPPLSQVFLPLFFFFFFYLIKIGVYVFLGAEKIGACVFVLKGFPLEASQYF